MRILHTEWSGDLGGQERRVLAEVTGFLKRGHHTAIVCRKGTRFYEEAIGRGIEVLTLPLRSPYDITSITRLSKYIGANRFDVVNTHSGKDSWIAGIAARLAGVPLLVRTRHLNIPLKRGIFNFIHYLPDAYITCGENMKKTLVADCGFPPADVVSIPTGVAEEFFDVKRDPALKLKYVSGEAFPIISNVGILRGVKGHEVTLRAVPKIIEAFPNARVLLVGDGPKLKGLQGMARSLGIDGHVVFTGYVAQASEIAAIYAFSDVSVLSSHSEGVPQSVMQAMAAGVPVVATRVGGVPEVVIHEQTGLLVNPSDHAALANGVIRLLQDKSLAADMCKRARRFIYENHSATVMLDKIEALYYRLLEAKLLNEISGH
ncbi:glycosyltransferase family 4 protein [Candidatus Magnetominusculus dajiuhuensis]|uniref:glycosyltransferase family 4 protein n=1 Tax=Candidatus Magnetominusculus dajiuhuensis TaxID=3137712 RepID=UPI003B431271